MKITQPDDLQTVLESVEFQGSKVYLGQLGTGHPDRDNTLELMLRYPPEFRGDVLLWRSAVTHWLASFRKDVESLTVGSEWVEDFYSWQKNLNRSSASSLFENVVLLAQDNCFLGSSPSALPSKLYHTIFMRIPANADQCVQEIVELVSRLRPDGKLWLCGLNSEGAKSLPKRLKPFGLKLMLRAQAASARLFEVSAIPAENVQRPAGQQIHWQVHSQEQTSLRTVPGVFSRRKLDAGTDLLLHSLPDMKGKQVLDLGCGAGFLAVYAASQGATVTATDHSALAVELCETNARNCGLHIDTCCSWAGQGIPGEYDLILTNPPFHQGKTTNMGVGRIWLKQCLQLLRPGGECRAVVNRFLNYREFGEELGLEMSIINETGAFRVWMFRLHEH